MRFLKIIFIMFVILVLIAIIALTTYLIWTREINKEVYYAKDFKIEVLKSKKDEDGDGIDDYTDILYPPDEEGVCTDVIWRSLKNAGYSLKEMVDEDIKNNVEKYTRVNGKPDPNIDFRRVPNLKVYFERNQISLTTDLNKIEEWQPGDIVVFGKSHIGVISDKRNKKGVPFLLHNGGQPIREENILEAYNNFEKISGHYRMKD